MFVRHGLLLFLGFACQCTAVLAAPSAPSQPAAAAIPVVHLLAPPAEYAAAYDCLIAETGLRYAAIDLAARHGRYARFWPVHQLDRIPADAWPRVQVSAAQAPPMPHLKLVRKGDLFGYFASADGKEYALISQAKVSMPVRTYVGFYAPCNAGKETRRSEVARIRLNGQPIRKAEHVAIGEPHRPARVTFSGDLWSVETYGTEPAPQGDHRLRGEFVYVPVNGDFELTGMIAIPKAKPRNGYSSLMCREDLGLEHGIVSLTSRSEGSIPVWRPRNALYSHVYLNYDLHQLHVDLLTAPGKSRRLASVLVSCVTWDRLAASADRVALRLQEGLARELGLPGSPLAATAATPAQQQALSEARELALDVCSRDILAGARKVDAVLDQSPCCPQAHYTAAVCGAVLASQELYGRFHDRGRFLAGPLSHWLFARRLAGPQQAGEHLAGAWVMLACGYPDAALASLEPLAEAARRDPECKAIEMFVTRDYRPLQDRGSVSPSAIEALAWLWATQQCDRTDLLKGFCGRLMENGESAAFSTLYNPADFHAPRHAVSVALARDSHDLLLDDRIPASQRKSAGVAIARAMGSRSSGDLPRLATTLEEAFLERGDMMQYEPDKRLSDALAGLHGLYAAALATPAGPTVTTDRLCWQCLGPADFADLQRGLLLTAMSIEVHSLAGLLGVPQETHDLCEALADGLAGGEGADAFFRGYGWVQVGQVGKATEQASRLNASAFGQLLSARCALLLGWQGNTVPNRGQGGYRLTSGRGAWDWADSAEAAMWDGQTDTCGALAWRCLAVDAYAHSPLDVLVWLAQSPAPAEAALPRLPYSMSVLTMIANAAMRYGQPARYVEVCQKTIELKPHDTTGYEWLAWYHANRGDRPEAIRMARQAVERCEWSICLSNLMGLTASWLVEEGQPEEALEWGRKSAESYSYRGLWGLAVALAANNKLDEAQDIYRQMAHRYDGGTMEYIRFLLRNGRPARLVEKEVVALLGTHAQMKEAVAGYVEQAWCQSSADPEALEKLYAGPLSFVPARQRTGNLLEVAMYSRRFDKAVEYGWAAETESALNVYERMWLHCAMRLSGRTERLGELEAKLREHVGKVDVSPQVEHVLGRIDEAELRRRSETAYQKSYTFWLRGVQFELDGKSDAALRAYETATEACSDGDARWLSAYWPRLLRASRDGAPDPGASSRPG